MAEVYEVKMADFKVAKNPTLLKAVALGSCVGVVLYDRFAKVGGLAHVMSPKEGGAKERGRKGKFPDTAIDAMVEEMVGLDAKRLHITAKLFGGANMYPNVHFEALMNIGDRISADVKHELERMDIDILAECLSGNKGRTITFDTSSGEVVVKTIYGDKKVY